MTITLILLAMCCLCFLTLAVYSAKKKEGTEMGFYVGAIVGIIIATILFLI
jgi:uncharacterized membrane protein